MNAERLVKSIQPKSGKTNKALIDNNTSFSGSFCPHAARQKNPHRKGIFQPSNKQNRYQIVRRETNV